MREEAEQIILQYGLKQVKKLYTLEVYESQKLVLILSGIGKVQASIAASFVCSNYEVSYCINIGIAGNLRWDEYRVWDVFMIREVSQHDIYLPFWGAHLDYAKKSIKLPSYNFWEFRELDFWYYPEAHCLTWDQFIDDAEKIEDLRFLHNADVIEMEAYAIASTLREYGYGDKFICIKAISDGADSDAWIAHMDNLDYAMKNSISILNHLLQKLLSY